MHVPDTKYLYVHCVKQLCTNRLPIPSKLNRVEGDTLCCSLPLVNYAAGQNGPVTQLEQLVKHEDCKIGLGHYQTRGPIFYAFCRRSEETNVVKSFYLRNTLQY